MFTRSLLFSNFPSNFSLLLSSSLCTSTRCSRSLRTSSLLLLSKNSCTNNANILNVSSSNTNLTRSYHSLSNQSLLSNRSSLLSSSLSTVRNIHYTDYNNTTTSFINTSLPFTMASSFSTSLSSSSSSSSSSFNPPSIQTISIQLLEDGICEIKLNRPTKLNAMNKIMWKEIELAFNYAAESNQIRVILLTGEGNHFTSGLDLQDHLDLFTNQTDNTEIDTARRAFLLRKHIKEYQKNISSVEECLKPVIAIVHGACIGGGVDLIATADIRIASSDAFFSIKEAEIGLAADVGTLQRLPKIIGNNSIIRELVYTARRFSAEEAIRFGMLSNVFVDRSTAYQHGLSIARKINRLSPVAIQGSKINLNFSRDHSVATSLEYQSVWNMGMLQTNDIPTAASANMTKTVPIFPKL